MTIAQEHREIRAVRRGYVLRIFHGQQIIGISVIQQRSRATLAKHSQRQRSRERRRPVNILTA